VNGNIVVASGGELAPGASPGTMIVNGNVSLNSGSTTIFELAPSGPSDHLIVNGTLAIAPGAVLNLTGDKALLPGATYDLFSATALTGRFDTITQSGAIQGVIGSSGNGISILATVAGPQSSTTQANAVIDYVNGLIASGQANPSLIAALPNLLGPDGRANAQAITRLGGEAYASAPQLAIEHGLAIVRAGRDGFAATTSAASGPFSFAEGVGAWRTLQSNTGAGTARATSNSHGAFAGFGFANQGSSIAAFIGYLDGRQNVATLDAHTDLDGVSLGVAGRANFGALSVSALFSYEWGKAGTHRTVVGNDMASDYRMYTATFDLSTNYTIALGQAWTLKPGAGLTHISTSHGQLSETGSTVFGLAVAAESFDATFIDGGVTLQRDGDTEEAIQPWIDVGVRHLLSGRRGVETIRFLDQTPTLISLGAARARTQATLTAGLAERLTDQLSFSANYTGEFGGGSGNALRAGLHYAF
jgi:hypothetical protein